MLRILTNPNDLYIQKVGTDPVRPEIGWDQRCNPPHSVVFVLEDSSSVPQAVLCCTFSSRVPRSRSELFEYSWVSQSYAVFYSVWSYSKGSGRSVIREAVMWIKAHHGHVVNFVTFSPQGEKVKNFHLGNGAKVLYENQDSVNYQYSNV